MSEHRRSAALEMIRAYFPELDQYIPHSEYFKIDVTKGEAK